LAPGQELFDFVFRLEGRNGDAVNWRRSPLVCERGITSGPLRDSRSVPLEEVPILAEVLSRAIPPRTGRTSSR